MWQGYVYVNDVRYSNIFTFAVGIFFVNTTQKSPEGQRPSGDFYVKRTGIEPIAVEPAGGRFRPPVRTLGATTIFAKGKNVNRSRSPAPKIPNANAFGIFTYSLFTIHSSLFTFH